MEQHLPHAQDRSKRFDDVAERASRLMSGGPFFAAMALFVVLSLVFAGHVLFETVAVAVTFLFVALLENSQRRYQEAVNLKLNAIAQGVADLMRERTGADQDLSDNIERLTQAVGLEERVTTKRG